MNSPFRPGSGVPSLADLIRDLPTFATPQSTSGLFQNIGSITVSQRFDKLLSNLKLTHDQRQDGVTKANGVYRCLNAHYYRRVVGSTGAFVGSWGKATEIRPPRDVDLLYWLPNDVYWRVERHIGNKQSQLLQEVKGVLSATYPTTRMRGDGQVVVVPFESYSVEVVPAFRLQSGKALICDTNNGGRYEETDPVAEIRAVNRSDEQTKGNTRNLIRMQKRWQEHCSVPLKSFVIELLAIEFLDIWPYRANISVYYDWMVRDFFRFLKQKPVCSFLLIPGTFQIIWLGEEWRSRAESASSRAEKACQFEADKMAHAAGEEWQKIFGEFIPIS